MKECSKCGMYNHAEITKTSACPECGAIYSKVDAALKDTNNKSNKHYKAKQKRLKADKSTKKIAVEAIQSTEKKKLSLLPGWLCFWLGIFSMVYSLGFFFLYLPLFLVAFVLSIIAMTQSRVSAGIVLLICTSALPVLTWAGLLATQISETFNTVESKTPPIPISLKLKSKEDYRNGSHQICEKKWTKRGEIDERMYDHCMEGQMEGYHKLKSLHKYADQEFYSKIAYPYCLKNWDKRGIVDTRMLSYCLDQEVEGMQDVVYYRKQYDAEQVNKIADRALSKYGSWKMASYSLKKATE